MHSQFATFPYSTNMMPPSAMNLKSKYNTLVSLPPLKKRRVIVTDVSDDEGISIENNAATALVRISKTPMAQWTKLFNGKECKSDDGDDELSVQEQKIVKTLVQAAFEKNVTSPHLARITGKLDSLTNPNDYLKALSSTVSKTIEYQPASTLSEFFEMRPDDFVKSYNMEVVKAMRKDDVETLRRLKDSGHSMNCGSKAGDTLLHAVCRRGSSKIVEFLLNECALSPRVACEYGRTPLHDACWTSQPNFHVINLLLDKSPDLLYITDNRGHNPLDFIPKQSWKVWCEFLQSRGVQGLFP
jgi:hypothetical protein